MSEIDLNTRFDHNKKYVNGPVNVVRLEGKIDGITKVVYLFMDFHLPIERQTKCDNIYAVDLSTYFAETFYKISNTDSKKKYDFFLEVNPTDTADVSYGFPYHKELNFMEKYIHEVLELFNKIFSYDPEKNIVSMSPVFKNVRLHYADVRIFFTESIRSHVHIVQQIANDIYNSRRFDEYFVTSANNVINVIINGYKNLVILLDDFLLGKNVPYEKVVLVDRRPIYQQHAENQQEKQLNAQKYILDKLFNKYHSTKVRDEIREQLLILRNNIDNSVSKLIKFLEEFNKITKDYGKPYILHKEGKLYGYGNQNDKFLKDIAIIYPEFIEIDNDYIYSTIIFMDAFFLRRLLDKDYITNAIVYTGGLHSHRYIEILTHKFGFRITHASYSTITDINELNKQVLKSNLDELFKIFYRPVKEQCSDLSNFPPDFL